MTKDYIEELLQIYIETCELNEKNYEKLYSLKKRFYNYYLELDKYNILQMYLSKNIEEFLKEYRIDNFEQVHKTLEGIIFTNFYVNIVPCLMMSSKSRDYFNEVVKLNRIKFAKNYKEVYIFEIISDDNNLIININKVDYQKFSDEQINIELTKSKKQLSSIGKERKIEIKLLKNKLDFIYNCLLPYLNFYKRFIEKNFYDVRELFLYYNIELRVFVGNSLSRNQYKDDYYEISIYSYTNDSNSVYVYPYVLNYYSNPSFNIEEMDKEIIMQKFTTAYFKGKSRNILNISEESIYEELIKLYWNIPDDELKEKFITNLFHLCGFIKVSKQNDIYKLKKYGFNLDKSKFKLEGEEFYFIIPTNIFYIDDNYCKKIINKVTHYNVNKVFYCICNVDTPRRDKLKKNKIRCISLRDIIEFLINAEVINLISTDILKDILMYSKDELRKQNELIKKGEKFLKDLDKTEVGKLHFKKFENIMCDVFDYLFNKSFDCYYSEKQSSEYGGHRFRDLVISNTAPNKEFWKQRKSEQNAKRIIVDFKNYSNMITQSTINDVSKYLNNKKGNFAIVVSASGIDNSAIKEQQFKYFDDNKLIIHVDKKDIVEMIYNKMNNKDVEIVLEKKLVELSVK